MNPALDQNQPELRVLVFAVDFEVLADCNRLFDEVPKVLWDGRCQSYPQTKGISKLKYKIDTKCDDTKQKLPSSV